MLHSVLLFVRAVACFVLCSVSCIFCLSSVSIAQNALYSSLRFDHLSIEQGLSQSSGNCILQDRRGFIWIGTQDGVNRYDGYTFSVFRHIPTDTTSLSDSWINGLYEDHLGQLWLLTRNGVNIFDAARERFTRLRVPLATAICSDSFGNVYISTIQGVYRYQHSLKTLMLLAKESSPAIAIDSTQNLIVAAQQGFLRITKNSSTPDFVRLSDASVQSHPIRAIATRADGTLMLMYDNLAVRIQAQSGKVLQKIALSPAHTPPNAEQAFFSVHTLPNGSIWLTSGAATTFWNLETQQTRTFTAPRHTTAFSAIEQINCATLQNENTLWIGTNLGAWIVSLQTLSIQRIEPDPTDKNTLNEPQILSMWHDRFGTMWLGARTGGVNTWNPSRYKFELVQHNPFKSNSLSADGVRGFVEDSRGLWVATDKGLNFFDTSSKVWQRFLPEQGNTRSLSHEYVSCLVDDGRGTLWCGSRFGGVSALDKKTRSFRQFLAKPDDSNALSHSNVFAMALAKHGANAGKIWIATQGGGLHLLDPATSNIRRFQRRTKSVNTPLPTDSIRSVFEDKQGRLWVGTSGYGLVQFSPERGVIARFTNNSVDAASLSNNTVTNIFEDANERLWIATAAGLNRFIPEKQAFERFTTDDGLPNAYIYGICEDKAGNLWLSTNNGLCAFNPARRSFRSFDVYDGLQSNEFNTGAFYASPSGRLYFGGVRGYNTFFPSQVLGYTSPRLPIVMIAFNVNDIQRAFTQPLAEIREIMLNHNENEISFEFVALDFQGAQKIRYSYLLEGFDKDWSEWGTRRYAAYTNLDAGTYRFRVRAKTSGMNEQGESTSLIIRIYPPFWGTWWFRLLALIAGMGLLYIGFQWRVRTLKRRSDALEKQVQQRTEQLSHAKDEIEHQNVQLHDQNIALELAIQELATLNKEKNEFLGIAAHDLKNPLTGIMLSANMITQYRQKMTEQDITDAIKKIYQSAERMFSIITNLLDINAIESGKFNFKLTNIRIDILAKSVVEDYRERAAQKQIELIVETTSFINSHESEQWCALADNAAAMEILENLVSNAVKYSPLEKRVWVRVLSGNSSEIAAHFRSLHIPVTQEIPEHSVIVCVQDEGFGISESDKRKLFGRFVKLSTRPTAGEHSTGLGLSIVKKMAEAMNGKVWCESEEGKGAAFILALPLEMPSPTK
jgi:signal transduction histidine kinase/ligand-binding sensor domain-containing protein